MRIVNAQRASPGTIYVTCTRRSTTQSKEAGLEFKDGQLTRIMISNLPASYDSFDSAIIHWDERKSTFGTVKVTLLTEYCGRQQQAVQRRSAGDKAEF
ncbi:hypothetical protein M514_18298 [Trichuris suis]|uniref:Uncharacterized protein n=1 Tax=Trichuris suis TaxID=68888 RepID=A0A085NIY0_9BILA|nr:hypothetical protein M514_18298 [Trichuris suis]